jgi:ABC-type glycerol-3-phosphate transport system permease component
MAQSDKMLTVPVGLATMYGSMHRTEYGALLAGAAISTAPILALFLLAQKAFIAGLTIGATKG